MKKKMIKKIFIILMALVLCLPLVLGLVACGGGDNPSGDNPSGDGGDGDAATVSKIEVETEPTKTEYYVDEEFTVEGGVILVTYSDDTTKDVSMTAEGVTLTEPDMSKTGNKTITVTYGGKKTTFKISVQNQGFILTYDYNYEGSTSTTDNIVKGKTATEPDAPTRSGYTFYAWYADADCTSKFDFSTPITADTTIYACWKDDTKTYYEVTFDLNYYGVVPQTYTQIVESGATAKTLTDPSRDEYTFNGWYTDESGTASFSADTAITADTSVYAGWTKTKTGTSTYVFEAEYTDLTGKTGPGFSGTAQESGMIVDNATASNNKAVSYMYQNRNSLEFYIACSEAVTDATIVLSLAAEMDNISFSSTDFEVIVYDSSNLTYDSDGYLTGGTVLSYSYTSIANNSTFSDAVTISGVSLNAGGVLIQLYVNNSTRPMGDASTYSATAPMIDCIKITTSAVLTWDANFSLPMSY